LVVSAAQQIARAFAVVGATGAFNETSGAILVAEVPDVGALNHIARVYQRTYTGPGTATFVFDGVAAITGTAEGVASEL
jgi:hypothetical protein